MKLLINTPAGSQKIIDIGEGGGYFDKSLVLWDEQTDGQMPEITIGGMVRVGNLLTLNTEMLALTTTTELLSKAAEVRAERNAKLTETDWTQGTDTPQAIKNKYAPYRQALRDVPTQSGFPNTVVWPTQE